MPQITVNSTQQLPELAQEILHAAGDKKVLLFSGQMGAGKTTLIKEICRALGSADEISSPTFSIVNEYVGKNGPLYHFDFHRLENEEEAYDIGAEEYFDSGNYCFIEWPEIVSNLLPSKDEIFPIRIEVLETVRIFTF